MSDAIEGTVVEVLTDENGNELVFAEDANGELVNVQEAAELAGIELNETQLLENLNDGNSETNTEVSTDGAASDVEEPTAEA